MKKAYYYIADEYIGMDVYSTSTAYIIKAYSKKQMKAAAQNMGMDWRRFDDCEEAFAFAEGLDCDHIIRHDVTSFSY